jgi:dTDP-4-dehydrorhamnose reductase
MNILLLGNSGQLGWELQRTLMPLGNITAIDYPEIDLANCEQIRTIVQSTGLR